LRLLKIGVLASQEDPVHCYCRRNCCKVEEGSIYAECRPPGTC
jgi:hypothetical protein